MGKDKKADKKEQALTVNPDDLLIVPDELVFRPPANPTATIDLENKGSVRISFKVKGTAVERYSVRPNRGLVQAKSKDKISLTLKKEPENEEFTDRFMVQWMPVPQNFVDNEENVKDLWIKAKEENRKVFYKNFPCKLEKTEAAPEPAKEEPKAEKSGKKKKSKSKKEKAASDGSDEDEKKEEPKKQRSF